MQDLTLVGTDEDPARGPHLVLAAADGTRFRLRADDALRLAARRGPGAPPAGAPAPVALTPREVQARLRAGEDAEDIAAASGTDVARVRRYEGPVLAERAHVAARARALPVRWRDGSGRTPALEELVAERLATRGVAETAWDAWRREDGAWLLQAAFRAGTRERRATWAYDAQREHLEPLDDEARWLSSVGAAEPSPPPGGAPRLAAVRDDDAPGRVPAAVDERVYDVDGDGTTRRTGDERPEDAQDGDDLDDGADAAEAAEADRRERAGRTLDLLDHLRGRRGRRQPLADPEDPDDEELEALTWAELEALTSGRGERGGAGTPGAEDPWDAAGEPPAAHPPASRPEEATDATVLAPAEPAADPDPAEPAGPAAAADEPSRRRRRRRGPAAAGDPAPADGGVPGQEELLPADAGTDPAAPRAPRRGARPGVPSWDDIVFGQKRD